LGSFRTACGKRAIAVEVATKVVAKHFIRQVRPRNGVSFPGRNAVDGEIFQKLFGRDDEARYPDYRTITARPLEREVIEWPIVFKGRLEFEEMVAIPGRKTDFENARLLVNTSIGSNEAKPIGGRFAVDVAEELMIARVKVPGHTVNPAISVPERQVRCL
jgi:hypothetical protein